jgi:hypothetical protein
MLCAACSMAGNISSASSNVNSLIMSMMRRQVLAGFGSMAGLSGLIFKEFANATQVLDEATILLGSLSGFGMPENR